jgi:N-acetylmuramoyl-L-alanine amidase
MKIVNHRLVKDDGTAYPFRSTPNQGGVIKPRWLVMHYTAGGSASESIGWLANPDAKASAHIVIGKDGSITQMVDFNRRAWHAGDSKWKDVDGLNGHSIGIELDGYGFLGKSSPWKFRSTTIPDSDVMVATHKFGSPSGGWPKYPQKQLDAALELAKLLVQTYKLEDVIGHDDISPGRKQDPGPAFNMATFRAAALAGTGSPATADVQPAPSGPRFRVTTVLNVRSGPDANAAPVAGSPLQANTFVRGLQDAGGWKRVQAEGSGVVGWVNAKFVEAVATPPFTVTTTLNIRDAADGNAAPVAGSPLPVGTVVEELENQGSWKKVSVQGSVNGRTGIVGWVAARFLQPAAFPVNGVNEGAQV